MSVKIYTEIITQNNQFTIVEKAHKPLRSGSAFATLRKIKDVIHYGLEYSNHSRDEYGRLCQDELWDKLREKAESIRNNYILKASKNASHNYLVKMMFGRAARKMQTIETLYKEIIKLSTPKPFSELPSELIQYIFRFLRLNDLKSLAAVNKKNLENVRAVLVERAHKYGYQGSDFSEAKHYLSKLLQAIITLVKNQHLPNKYVVSQNQLRSFSYEDSEATLRKILYLNSEESEDLKSILSNALFRYLEKNEIDPIRVLLKLGANPNVTNFRGKTSLHLAMSKLIKSYKIRKELVELLLSYNADPSISDNNGFTPLSVNSYYSELIGLLCEKGAPVNQPTAREKYCPLHFASEKGQIETVRILLKYKADPNLTNRLNETPLHFAALNKKTEVVALLLHHGANPNIANDIVGFTPLCLARRSPQITQLLCEKGANVNHQTIYEGDYALHLAVSIVQLETVKILLKHGANPDVLNNFGEIPLHLAMEKFRRDMNPRTKEVIKLLLAYKANPNIPNQEGLTPLCIDTNCPEITELLCKKGALVNHPSRFKGNSPLHFAAKRGQIKIVRILLKYGADPNLSNLQGQTPFDISENNKIKQLLL